MSLALGIGANTAIFSVSWVLFSQPLAVQDPDNLLAITNRLTTPREMRGTYQINGASYFDPVSGRDYRANFSFPAYLALREAAGDAADVFAYSFVGNASPLGRGESLAENAETAKKRSVNRVRHSDETRSVGPG